MLTARVRAGDLPPLEKRLPERPLVEEPLNAPGRYGGTLRGTALGPTQTNDIQYSVIPALFRFSHDLTERREELAESFELSDDARKCLIRLRKGIKWSDGALFSADDMMFYFEDVELNPDFVPVSSVGWRSGDTVMRVAKVDDYAVEFEFATPNPSFALLHASYPPREPYLPKHFLEKFHPKYNPNAEREATREGYSGWQDRLSYFSAARTGVQVPERPDLAPWVPVENSQHQQRHERNPVLLEGGY